MEHIIEDIKATFSLTKMELMSKKQEVSFMILNPENNYKLSLLNVDDLMKEYKEKMLKQSIHVEVESVINGYGTTVAEDIALDPETEAMFDKL